MADDLVQRARAAADTSIEPHAKHLLPEGTRHYVYDSEMRELLHALADAIARKDAEIAELRARIADAPTAEVTLGCYLDAGQLPTEFALRRVALVVVND